MVGAGHCKGDTRARLGARRSSTPKPEPAVPWLSPSAVTVGSFESRRMIGLAWRSRGAPDKTSPRCIPREAIECTIDDPPAIAGSANAKSQRDWDRVAGRSDQARHRRVDRGWDPAAGTDRRGNRARPPGDESTAWNPYPRWSGQVDVVARGSPRPRVRDSPAGHWARLAWLAGVEIGRRFSDDGWTVPRWPAGSGRVVEVAGLVEDQTADGDGSG